MLAALPDGQRRAPVPGPRQGPVHVVAQPLPVPALLDAGRLPVRPLVLRQQLVLDLGGADVPGRQRVVQQRRMAPPAVRVAVVVEVLAEHQPTLGQVMGQDGVGVGEEHPAHQRHRREEPPIEPDRVDHRQPVGAAHLHVVRTERGRHVHEPGALFGAHEVSGHDHMSVRDFDQAERRAVAGPRQFAALDPGQNMPALARAPARTASPPPPRSRCRRPCARPRSSRRD